VRFKVSFNDKKSPVVTELFLLVGVAGFEPATSASQTRRDNRATLHPENSLSILDCKYIVNSLYSNYIFLTFGYEMFIKLVMRLKLFLFFSVLSCFYACSQDKNPVNTENAYEVIVPDLTIPWGFTFLPDGALLITEKTGQLIHFKDGIKSLISGAPEVYLRGQGGFMDIILDPL
jgi:hypothetical protein